MIFSKIEFNDEEPLYLQIENYIKSMITSNLLVSDGKLPATRELSKLLGVSRNSVITAYEIYSPKLYLLHIIFEILLKSVFKLILLANSSSIKISYLIYF